MNVFKDNDGEAYLICSVNSNQDVALFELDSTYTVPVREVFRGTNSNSPDGIGCEGHAIFKSGSRYFWIESFCSGWDPNDNRYYTSTSLAGPWTSRGNIAPIGAKTYQSQVTNTFAVTGSGGTTYVYMGDRWSVDNYSMTRLILQPLEISDSTLNLPWNDQWSISTTTGLWSAGPPINFEGEFNIVNRYSGKVMDAPSVNEGQSIIQWTKNGGENQKWAIENMGGGEYRIVNFGSGKPLDNPSSSRTPGTNVIIWTDNGGYNQRWHVIKTASGFYRIVNVQSSGKSLEIANASAADGAGVVIGNFGYGEHQEWELLPIQSTVTIEEDTTGFCSVNGTVDNNYAGYNGSGFANPDDSTGAGVNWRVNFGTNGTKTFTIRYANGSGSNRPANLLVNGTVVASAIAFPPTNNWTTWSTVTVSVDVNTNPSAIVRLEGTSSGGTANIDNITITNSTAAVCGSPDEIVLPLKLISFSGKALKGTIQLTWQTSDEVNTNYFELQRSFNGKDFFEIATEKAIGQGSNFYHSIDRQPQAGKNYYRLKILDKDGRVTYTLILTITTDNSAAKFTMYPNPARNVLVLACSGTNGSAVITIYNQSGQKVLERKMANSNVTIPISHLAKGVYSVKIVSNNYTEVKKMMKE